MHLLRNMTLFCLMSSSTTMLAGSNLIFSGDEQCRLSQTTSGLRYTLPCRLDDLTLAADTGILPPAADTLAQLPHLQRIRVQFTCESLRPVKITWREVDGLNQGEIAPQSAGYALAVDVTSPMMGHALQFHLVGLDNGIQALKPGCRAEAQLSLVYVDPKGLDVYLRILSRENRNLARIFQDATPDLTGESLGEAMDQALEVLDLLLLSADPVSQIQIEDSVLKLKNAKKELEQSCGAGSAANVCTAGQAKVRATLDALLEQSAAELKSAQDYLQTELQRLQSQALMTDVSSSLQTLSQKYFPAP